MRTSLLLAALLVLLSLATGRAALGLRGSSSVLGGQKKQQPDEDDDESIRTSSSSSRSTSDSNSSKRQQSPGEPPPNQKKYRLPGQQTRRERRCLPHEQEVCGNGLGHLLCEYNEEKDVYATRCVKQPKTSLHLQLHPNNYCGTCRRCFEDADELRHAVAEYIKNSTEHTEVAHNYGWPMNKWCVSKISDFSDLFANQRKFKEDIGDWDLSNAVNTSGMFQAAFSFNHDLSRWQTNKVVDMSRMFDSAFEFNQPLGMWNTRQVTSMARMFRVAKKFNQDLSPWKIRKVRDTSYMFYRAHSFDRPLQWDTSNVVDMSFMFAFTRRFNDSSVVDWDVSKVETLRGTFQSTASFDQDLSGWDIRNVKDTAFLFYKAVAFQKDDEKTRAIVTEWDLSQVEDKENMFDFTWNNTATAKEGVMLTHPAYDGSTKMSPAALVEMGAD
jgi:Mycoplasma protein of unknown function, DUF285